MKPIICALAALMLMGCASQKSLTIYTNPPGATLYEQGGSKYTSPITLYYDTDPAYTDAAGCRLARPFTAVWSSGAKVDADSRPLRLCHEHSAITIDRPDVAGLEHDLKMADLMARRALLSEIQRLEGQAAMAEGMETLGEAIGCQIAGGCGSGGYRQPSDVTTRCTATDSTGTTRCTSRDGAGGKVRTRCTTDSTGATRCTSSEW